MTPRALLIFVLLLPMLTAAAPVPETERGPVDVRRTTLLVRDIDQSLRLYRDALGLTVVYDEEMGAGTDENGNEKQPSSRLVLLRANDDFIGAIGLYERYDDPEPRPVKNERPVAGDPILVINAKDLQERFDRIRQAPGVTVDTEPELREYPSPEGGTIPVMFSAIYDADGFFIEINNILGKPAGRPSE